MRTSLSNRRQAATRGVGGTPFRRHSRGAGLESRPALGGDRKPGPPAELGPVGRHAGIFRGLAHASGSRQVVAHPASAGRGGRLWRGVSRPPRFGSDSLRHAPEGRRSGQCGLLWETQGIQLWSGRRFGRFRQVAQFLRDGLLVVRGPGGHRPTAHRRVPGAAHGHGGRRHRALLCPSRPAGRHACRRAAASPAGPIRRGCIECL